MIAVGGRPVIPPVVADSGLPYETSDTIMRIDAPPRRLAVLGGGYIAAELAHVFAAAGSEITIIEKQDMLLGGPQDDEVRRTFTDLMRDRWDLHLGTELDAVDGTPGDLTLTLADGSTVAADVLLVASGRTPNADRLERRRRRASTSTTTAGCRSTSSAAPAPTASSRSATSARPSRSNTWPTARPTSSSTICCTRTGRERQTTTTFPRPCSPSHRWLPSA